jgi:isoleucyl-tRNA synthetase
MTATAPHGDGSTGDLRRVVTGALELERAQKRIGSSLQADAQLYVREEDRPFFEGVDLAELCITSSGAVRTDPPPSAAFAVPDVPGAACVIGIASGEKCARCWKVLPEVGSETAHPALCRRCADAVEGAAAHA